jgi:ElaB/YqjD/DUF883 family membrane-anchored ribosome-binding protein
MGLFNDMKRLLFGAKSVTKSAGRKAYEKGKETSREIREEADEQIDALKDRMSETGQDLRERAQELSEDLTEKGTQLFEDARDKAREIADEIFGEDEQPESPPTRSSAVSADPPEDIPVPDPTQRKSQHNPQSAPPAKEEAPYEPHPLVEKAERTAEEVGKKVLDKSDELLEKAGDLSEKVGEKVLEKGGKVYDQLKEKTEEIGGKVWDKAKDLYDKAQEEAAKEAGESDMVQKAQEATDNQGAQMDELTRKAKEIADKLDENVSSSKPSVGGSMLDGSDDFFDRAARFAEGDYHNEGAKKKEGEITISHKKEEKQKDNTGRIKGFEDRDGDGDDLIDDAILDEE